MTTTHDRQTPAPGLEFRRVLALRGPNIWANYPVIEAWVDLGKWADTSSADVPGFNEQLMGWLPTMVEHRCSVGTRGGFFERLRRGTYPAHILEHVTLELQSLAGTPVGYGRARALVEEGVYRVVFRYHEERLGRACLEAARELLLAALESRTFDVAGTLAGLRTLAAEVLPDAGSAAIVTAARERGVPVFRLKEGAGLFQLGQGARQRRVWAGETDRTGAVGQEVAGDGELTQEVLLPLGIPMPERRWIQTAEEAWEGAEEFGPPVVVRPSRRVFGPGVATGLMTREQVFQAFATARAESTYVVVEKWNPGALHHLLVVGDRVAAAVRREMEHGRSESEGLEDVTDILHPEVAARAVEASQGVGLDIAGIDLLALSVARPLEGQGGLILRAQSPPDLETYLEPNLSPPRPVGQAIVESLFPEGDTGRIPVVGVTGGPERSDVARLLAAILSATGLRVGRGASGLLEVGGRRLANGSGLAWESARSVLIHPEVEAAVLEVRRAEVLAEGLGFDRCAVGVVTGLDESLSAADWGFEEPEAILRAERCVVDIVPPDGWAVLRADDPRIAAMAEHCRGRLVLVARDGTLPALSAHRAQGGRVAFVRDGAIVRAEGGHESSIAGLDQTDLPVETLLAAVAAAWALEVGDEAIRAGMAMRPH